MPTRKLASFPNSRIKPRPATRDAVDFVFTLPSSGVLGTPGAPVKILDANENRTYFNLENIAPDPAINLNSLRFGYAPLGAEGAPPADLTTNGFTIVPGAGLADQPSPQELWAVNMSDVDATNNIVISVEEGQG